MKKCLFAILGVFALPLLVHACDPVSSAALLALSRQYTTQAQTQTQTTVTTQQTALDPAFLAALLAAASQQQTTTTTVTSQNVPAPAFTGSYGFNAASTGTYAATTQFGASFIPRLIYAASTGGCASNAFQTRFDPGIAYQSGFYGTAGFRDIRARDLTRFESRASLPIIPSRGREVFRARIR